MGPEVPWEQARPLQARPKCLSLHLFTHPISTEKLLVLNLVLDLGDLASCIMQAGLHPLRAPSHIGKVLQ